MRKLWFAGAVVASGFLLVAAAPAQADGQPGTADALLLTGLLPNGEQQSYYSLIRPAAGGTESASTGMPLLGGLAGARPVDGLPIGPDGDPPDVSGLPGGGMAVLAPADTSGPATAVPTATAPTSTATAPATGPTSAAPVPTTGSTSASPAPTGATPTTAAATLPSAGASAVTPGKHKIKVTPTATASADPTDPRLHEEPVDGEATRTFSPGGRPVAGVDQQHE